MAYDVIEPFGEQREDIRIANAVRCVAKILNGDRLSQSDLLPFKSVEREQTEDEIQQEIMSAFGF